MPRTVLKCSRSMGAQTLVLSKKLFSLYIHPDKLFKRQFHKMAKHTQKIRRQFADELFECV